MGLGGPKEQITLTSMQVYKLTSIYRNYEEVKELRRCRLTEYKLQLETFQEYCKSLGDNTCIRSVTDTLRNLKVQSHLSEVFKRTKLILVLPATNGTSDRNHLMILSAYRNKLDQLNLTKIASDFTNKKITLVSMFLVNSTSGLPHCTLFVLDFLWFDIFDVKLFVG